MTIETKRMRRTRQRGAAMVEAAVVLPVLAIFLGLIVFKYTSYREKMKVQETARENALYFASHGCQGTSGGLAGFGGYGPAGYQLDTGGGDNGQSVISKGPPGGGAMQSKTDRSFNMASSTQSTVASAAGRARPVTGSSYVYCNERPEDGTPVGVIKWAFNFFRTGVL